MRWLAVLILGLGAMGISACGGSTSSDNKTGGGSGGKASGGAGGTNSGGTNAGGTSSGGTNSGGTNAGGTSSGGVGGSAGGTGGSGGVCPDYTAPQPGSTTCQSQQDCNNVGQICLAPGAKIDMCGACMLIEHLCDNDGECATDLVCVKYTPPCACEPGEASQCQAKCTTNSTCTATERCRSDGHCESWPCNEGFTCATDSQCKPGASSADANGCVLDSCAAGFACPENTRCTPDTPGHGCAPLGCKVDSDCDCGSCIDSYCAAGPGVCVSLPG